MLKIIKNTHDLELVAAVRRAMKFEFFVSVDNNRGRYFIAVTIICLELHIWVWRKSGEMSSLQLLFHFQVISVLEVSIFHKKK